MQHTTKLSFHKDKNKKADGYLLYSTIICRRVSTRPQDIMEEEEERIKAKATKKVRNNTLVI